MWKVQRQPSLINKEDAFAVSRFPYFRTDYSYTAHFQPRQIPHLPVRQA